MLLGVHSDLSLQRFYIAALRPGIDWKQQPYISKIGVQFSVKGAFFQTDSTFRIFLRYSAEFTYNSQRSACDISRRSPAAHDSCLRHFAAFSGSSRLVPAAFRSRPATDYLLPVRVVTMRGWWLQMYRETSTIPHWTSTVRMTSSMMMTMTRRIILHAER